MVMTGFRVDSKELKGSPSRDDEKDRLVHSLEVRPSGAVKAAPEDDYSRENVLSITKERCGWLITFCLGLLLSALIVERFEDLLEHHVQLSFFVPLIMGHGGNTGSQTVSTLIRALALRQIGQRDLLRTVIKESIAGALMGGLLGALVLLVSLLWPHLGPGVGLAVGLALPIISMWANGVGALLTMLADRFKFDPAVTSVPLMTTIVDATGLIIYFYIAELFLDVSANAEAAHEAQKGMAAAAAGSGNATAQMVAAAAAAASKSGAAKVVTDTVKKLMSPPPPAKHAPTGKKGLFL
ncbi:hypothetical protein HYH02_007352 [Chlamydomonas schloesseri]|uniref:SLC41A/MgtE integral membrane domain-containing protein n=1 Tax=Chlamydomonas schloesseri TaxID=2026947 RepID=A0A835WHZ6_9CHLO|nr:hypothetical protein HYH02_007352 [Chlamydomonas schloesseri]|eukprot:KAG2447898.1 hypothetical protein HYH02_007352 [Chlamydomonas schloesseri]